MIVSAQVSFAGKTTMSRGEKRNITDKAVLADLLNAGYVASAEDKPTGKAAVSASAAKKLKKSTKKES